MIEELDKIQEHFDLLRTYRKDDSKKIFDQEVEIGVLKERNAVLRRFWEESQKKVEELDAKLFNLQAKEYV